MEVEEENSHIRSSRQKSSTKKETQLEESTFMDEVFYGFGRRVLGLGLEDTYNFNSLFEIKDQYKYCNETDLTSKSIDLLTVSGSISIPVLFQLASDEHRVIFAYSVLSNMCMLLVPWFFEGYLSWLQYPNGPGQGGFEVAVVLVVLIGLRAMLNMRMMITSRRASIKISNYLSVSLYLLLLSFLLGCLGVVLKTFS